MNLEATPIHACVLVFTDNRDASRAWTHVLSRYEIDVKVSSLDTVTTITDQADMIHVILVDYYDTSTDVLNVCKRLRTLFYQPLLLFTYENDERFHLEAYRVGVEECVTKPIGIPLFVAKTRSWLRQVRQREGSTENLTVNGFTLDPETRLLEFEGSVVKLSVLESRLLSLLMMNRDQILETDLLTQRVWYMDSDPNPTMLKNLVYRLRHKMKRISDGRDYIESIEGIGYKFQAG